MPNRAHALDILHYLEYAHNELIVLYVSITNRTHKHFDFHLVRLPFPSFLENLKSSLEW